ncbi:hypothetical protein FB107DRAFT_293211 [Schizophyllum commune]
MTSSSQTAPTSDAAHLPPVPSTFLPTTAPTTSHPRVALITGAAQGIGKAIAFRLARDGLHVALNDLPDKRDALEEVARTIEKDGGRAAILFGDVSKEEDVQAMVDGTVEKLGSLHVMVANAGIGGPGPFLDESLESFNHHMAVDAAGVFLCYQIAARKMIEQAQRGLTSYTAAEFAVRGLTQCAALALGKHGITANAYAPGLIDTAILADHDELERITGLGDKASRIGQPEDVASLVSFLASKEAGFITGESRSILEALSVDGGARMD